MSPYENLDILNTVTSIRLQNREVHEDSNGLSYYLNQLGLGPASCHNYYEVTATITGATRDPAKTNTGDRGSEELLLLESVQKKGLISSGQDGKIDFFDNTQRPVLQMEFTSNRSGFLWNQNQRELHVSTNGLQLGKIVSSNPHNDKFTIHDFTGPSVYYDIVQSSSQPVGTSSKYSIYYSPSLSPPALIPHAKGKACQNHEPVQSSFLAAEISQEEEDTTSASIYFKDEHTNISTAESNYCRSLSTQAKALLLGLMAFMTTLAPQKLQQKIHNEAAYTASTILLY